MFNDVQMQKLQEGVLFFKSNPESEDTTKVANSIGHILEVPGMPAVQTLTPRESHNEEKSSYSGNFGMGAFPFHTDLAHWYIPPRYFLLRCIVPSNNVKTKFVSSSEVFSLEDPISLNRSLFRPRRRLDGRLNMLRLKHDELYRWDTLFIKPMTDSAIELQSRITERIEELPHLEVSLNNSGDCILVDNWKVIHSRTAVQSADTSRKIERVYMSGLKV